MWLAGRALARRAARDRVLAAYLTPGLALALWILAVHIAALVTRSFAKGLAVGTLAPSALGVAVAIATRRGHSRPMPARSPSAWMWILGLGASLGVVAQMASGGAFHDDLSITGHMSTVAQMQNGTYPPRFLPFVEHELRYHYAFDTLAAMATALFRVQIDHAIDGVTVVLWFYSFCLLWLLGDRLLGRNRGFITASLTLFGGGVAPLLFWYFNAAVPLSMASFVTMDESIINAPLLSYFFQHPWALGVPFLACVLLLATDRAPSLPARRRHAARYAALGLLLLALSVSQVVCFLGLLAALPAAAALDGGLARWRRIVWTAATSLVVLLVATRLHGFFAPSYHPGAGLGLVFERAATTRWQLVTFGILLPLGLAGLVVFRRVAALAGLLAAGSILIINVLRYAHSADIFKFATLGSIALSILASGAIARLFAMKRRAVGAALGSLCLAIGLSSGFAFAWAVLADPPVAYLQRLYHRRPEKLGQDDAAALSWLRGRVKARELVYREGSASSMYGYTYWGGIAGPWSSDQALQHGFTSADMARWKRLLRTLPDDVNLYTRNNVAWLVLNEGAGPSRLKELAATWEAEGRAKTQGSFGRLRVVKLYGAPRATR
jgi:hypothetical protein